MSDERVTVDRWQADPAIAIITIDNPPVNAMSIGVPQGIVDHVKALNDDDGVSAVLIAAGGRGLLGGADIKGPGQTLARGAG